MSQRRLEEQMEEALLTLALTALVLPLLLVWWLWKAITQHDY